MYAFPHQVLVCCVDSVCRYPARRVGALAEPRSIGAASAAQLASAVACEFFLRRRSSVCRPITRWYTPPTEKFGYTPRRPTAFATPRGMVSTLRLFIALAAAYAQCAHAQNATVPTGTGTDPAWLEYDAPFAQLIPPIFRVLLMIALGIVGFGTDLNVLQHWGMNIWSNAGPSRLPVHRTVQSARETLRESGAIALYVLAGAHSAWLLLCWALYRASVDPVNHERTLMAQGWEVVALAGLLAFWFIPNPFWHAQRASMRYV